MNKEQKKKVEDMMFGNGIKCRSFPFGEGEGG
jgi:hypothetical protein